jgi:putative phosphoesterase
MKYLVVSDIHGSAAWLKKFMEIVKNENSDKVILLGDVYYHGPRNALPEGYAPMEVAEMLNSIADKIISVKGNCDAEVDQMISNFEMNEKYETEISGLRLLFVHGHHLDFQNLPKEYNVVFGGHTHVSGITSYDGTVYVNPGSLSIPKGGTTNGYAKIEGTKISLHNLQGETLHEIVL